MWGAFLGLLKNPKRAVRRALLARKYRTPQGYDAERFWQDRHAAYGFDLRGVGYTKLSHADNEEAYAQGRETLLALCRREGVDLGRARMLDIGCGSGFYARVFREAGGRAYLGVDLTNVLLESLRGEFPAWEFRKLDVSKQELPGEHDLIVMLDVTQHITQDEKFSWAMQNVRRHLSPQGVFLVTSWLDAHARQRFFEKSRDQEAYVREFPGCRFGAAVPFRDKFLFSIRPPSV